MAKRGEVYKCQICGIITEILHEGEDEMVCCNQPMTLMQEKTAEEGLTEKHLPVVEKSEKGILVKIGSVPHPMEETHWIEWVEIQTASGKIMKKFLKPSDTPEVEFDTGEKVIAAREYCNLHGLWVTRLL